MKIRLYLIPRRHIDKRIILVSEKYNSIIILFYGKKKDCKRKKRVCQLIRVQTLIPINKKKV